MSFQADGVAWLITVVDCVLVLKAIEKCSGYFSANTTRKLTHIFMGLIFVVHWGLFSSDGSRYFAGIIPLALGLQIAAVGLGLIKDEKLVKSLSRSGNPRDLLIGPLSYGVCLAFATLWYWRASPVGVSALCILCAGDGLAGLIGYKYGSYKLPWNPNKSWVGLITFFIASVVSSIAFVFWFILQGWLFKTTFVSFMKPLLISIVCSTFAESFIQGEYDNIVVFVVPLLVMRFYGFS